MPLLSSFTTVGLLELSSRTAPAESIYNALKASLGTESLSVEPGTRQDATFYAQAMGIARVRKRMATAAANEDPLHCVELLPTREREYRLTPGPSDTIPQRQGELAARMVLPLGASATNVTNALLALLGADFVAYRPTPIGEAVASPSTIAGAPLNFRLPSVPLKVIRITGYVAVLGVEITVPYEAAGVMAPGSPAPTLLAEDVLVFNPGKPGLEERVDIVSATATELVARFNKAHESGTVATSQPYPAWLSTKRHSLVVVTPAAAVDPVKRTKIHGLMQRITRAVSTWDIVAESTSGHTGPFLIGSSLPGSTTIGDVTI